MVDNWAGFNVKCYKIPIVETEIQLPHLPFPTKFYAYAGMVPGPTFKMRLGQPVVVRYQNHLETETSIHLHGGHSPSHSDGFPTFYVLQGKSRDYFYPNILPLKPKPKLGSKEEQELVDKAANSTGFVTDPGEAQSTMWYHDHAMDATSYNVAKGLAGFAPCLGEDELRLLRDGVLPAQLPDSVTDREINKLETDPAKVAELEDRDHPGFYRYGQEPYHNPFDIPIVLQDKVIDPKTGQIAFDNDAHNGYLGNTFFLNGVAWPYRNFQNRKYRFRFLNGSNARIYRLRILSEADYFRLRDGGIDPAGADEGAADVIGQRSGRYEEIAKPFLRIGKDTWMWSEAVTKTSVVLGMANRADLVVDFTSMAADLKAGEEARFYLVTTMPQFDGRGPKALLNDGGDPRVLPLPFDTAEAAVPELNRPIGLMKFVVQGAPIAKDVCVKDGTPLLKHDPIGDDEVQVVREFVFHRGKGAWKVNHRFYDPTIANATPTTNSVEEWVLRNGGGGWWHPIHIHLESHQLISYEKDFAADAIVDPADPPATPRGGKLTQLVHEIDKAERIGLHDTQILGPNTVARIRMRFRTWTGPFVFHCHNLDHEDMRMMHNFEPVPRATKLDQDLLDARREANIAPGARTHGDEVTLQPDDPSKDGHRVGELPWDYPPVPGTPVGVAGKDLISPRPKPRPKP